jgi:hypothetical protein
MPSYLAPLSTGLIPCDVSATIALRSWQDDAAHDHDKEFSWSLAPRKSIVDNWAWHEYCLGTFNSSVKTADDRRFREYFLLRGLIYRWILMYDTIANRSSCKFLLPFAALKTLPTHFF